MAIVIEQLHTKINSDSTNGSAQTASFTSTPTIGNYVFLVVSGYLNSTDLNPTVTDNQATGGNTYHRDSYLHRTSCTAYVYSAPVTKASGTFTISITAPAGTYMAWTILEVSGLSASALDQVGTLSAGSGTSGTVTAAGANGQASELVIACISAAGSNSNESFTDPASSGYSSLYVENNGTIHATGEGAYKIVSGIETSAASWTWVSNVENVGALATYKGASAGATATISTALMMGI